MSKWSFVINKIWTMFLQKNVEDGLQTFKRLIGFVAEEHNSFAEIPWNQLQEIKKQTIVSGATLPVGEFLM